MPVTGKALQDLYNMLSTYAFSSLLCCDLILEFILTQ